MALGIVNFKIFLKRFLNLPDFSRKPSSQTCSVGTMEVRGSKKLYCNRGHSKFFNTSYRRRKSRFFPSFMHFTEKYLHISEILCSIRFWVSQKNYGPQNSQKVETFFKNCLAKPGLLGSIEISGCVNLLRMSGYAQIFSNKSYDSRKLSDFFGNFLTYSRITVPIFRLSVQLRNPILRIISFYHQRPAFSRKKYGFRNVKFLNFDCFFFRNFLNFLENYPSKSEMKSSIERSCCASFSCRSSFFLLL